MINSLLRGNTLVRDTVFSGFNPSRGDFEFEYDDTLESFVADLEISENDLDKEDKNSENLRYFMYLLTLTGRFLVVDHFSGF